MKIKSKILLIFFLSILTVVVGYIFFIIPKYVVSEANVLHKSLNIQLNQMESIIDEFQVRTQQDMKFILMNKEFYESKSKENDDKILEIFTWFKDTNRQIKSIYMADRDGEILTVDEPESPDAASGENQVNRQWYKLARQMPGKMILSEPFTTTGDKEIYVTASQAITDKNGEFFGVMATDVSIGPLQKYLVNMQGQEQYGTRGIIHQTNSLTVTQGGSLKFEKISEMDQNIMNSLKESGGSINDFQHFNGKAYYCIAREAKGVPWILYFTIEETYLENSVYGRILPVIGTGAALTVSILIMLLIVFQMLVGKPLAKLSRATEHIIKTKDLNTMLNENCKDEIGILSKSFNQMIREIRDNRDVLESIVEERTKELRKLTVAVEQSPSNVVITDPNGVFIYVNQKMIETSKFTYEELIGNNMSIIVVDEHNENIFASIDKAMERGETWENDIVTRDKYGALSWHRCLIAPVFNDNHEIINSIAITNDITDQKRAQEELILAKSQAESAAQAKSDFLANMSHEIRTPMNAIIGLNGLLENTDLNARQLDYVSKIGKSANNLLGIINDILDYSKIEAGKLNIEKIDFSIDEVIESLSNTVGMKAFTGGLEFIIDQDNHVPTWLKGDPLRLGQILLNITSNATKFTKSGEVVLKVEVREKSPDTVSLYFEVRDTGIGMSPDQVSRLFKAFSQADTSTTRKFGGTGLGLAISKDLVEKMGGDLHLESHEGKGSRFFFTLEFGIGEEREENREIIDNSIRDINIVVVEDNETTREVLKNCLQGFVNEPHIFTNGNDTLEYFKSGDPVDLVIMDYKLEGPNGAETWTQIKQILQDKGDNVRIPKVIMATAYGREDVIVEAETAGIDNIMMKPVTKTALIERINRLFTTKVVSLRQNQNHELLPDFSGIKGASILLVEDNEINQQVAKENLENYGFWVDVASDGREAVEMVLANVDSYDIVLMDLQMPVMDGYSASQKIRENLDAEALPIIALSADVMEGIIERVHEAGMQGHVSKPINPIALINMLVKWVKPGKRAIREIENRDEQGVTLDQSYLSSILKSFDVIEGIERMSGRSDDYVKLLKKFKNSSQNALSDLLRVISEGNLDVARREIHTLKGVSANVGAKGISNGAKLVEDMVREDSITHTKLEESSAFLNLEIELSKALSEIDALPSLQNTVDLTAEVLTKETFAFKLDEILSLLEDYDTEAEEQVSAIKQTFVAYGLEDVLVKIEKAIGDYNFEMALELCREIKKDII